VCGVSCDAQSKTRIARLKRSSGRLLAGGYLATTPLLSGTWRRRFGFGVLFIFSHWSRLRIWSGERRKRRLSARSWS